MKVAVILLAWATALAGLFLVGRRLMTRRRSLERAFAADAPAAIGGPDPETADFLTRWLFRAGFRRPSAALVFLGATALLFVMGLAGVGAIYLAGIPNAVAALVAQVPGGLADILMPGVYVIPWLPLLLFTCVPLVVVRAGRRRRVEQVEHDLPITLELLATLSEAGLGFDAALDRVLKSQPADRSLAEELRIFQLEVLAGRPRVQCLRRLGWRIDVTSLTIFISAMVQSVQVGAGVAEVLRRQADDQRARRREQALGQASAVPTKLLFPLVVCFLPGLMVATLGPTFFQIFQFLDNLIRARGLR